MAKAANKPKLPPLRDHIRGCRTWADVEAVRIARGYAPGWTEIIKERYRIAAAKNPAMPDASEFDG